MTYTNSNIVFEPKPTHPNFKDVTGQQYGRLTVIGFGGRENVKTFWYCECSCGIIKRIPAPLLQSGRTQSCGCLRVETSTLLSTTHGMRDTPEYGAFYKAKDRCNNPNDPRYRDYGGRGIQFRFNSFEEFFAEVGLRPENKTKIDRRDVNGHYEKGNLRWVNDVESAGNTRSNRHITYDGRTKILIEWSRETGFSPSLILSRLKAGWSVEKTLSTPPRPIKQPKHSSSST